METAEARTPEIPVSTTRVKNLKKKITKLGYLMYKHIKKNDFVYRKL